MAYTTAPLDSFHKGIEGSFDPISAVGADAIKSESTLRRDMIAAALSISLLGSPTYSQDSNQQNQQYAELSPTIIALQTGEIQSDALPPELAWVSNLDLGNPAVSDLLRMRIHGIEYYGPYLKELSQLSPADQAFIANGINTPLGGPDISVATIELVKNLRVPESLQKAILEEARNTFIQESGPEIAELELELALPGFIDVLNMLRNEGNTDPQAFGFLYEKAKNTTSLLYIVIVSQALLDANQAATDANQAATNANQIITERDQLQDEATKALAEALKAIK